MTQQINLIDASLQASQDKVTGKLVVSCLAGFGLLVFGHYVFEQVAWQRMVAQTAALEAANAANEASAGEVSDPQAAELAALEAKFADRQRLRETIAALMDPPHEPAKRLQDVISHLPHSVWLRNISFSGANGLTITGCAIEGEDLAFYSTRLGALPRFKQLPLYLVQLHRQIPKAEDAVENGSAAETQAAATADADMYADPDSGFRSAEGSCRVKRLGTAFYSFELAAVPAQAGTNGAAGGAK